MPMNGSNVEARTPEEAQAIIDQMEEHTGHTLSSDQRQMMMTDLQNGAKVDMPGLVDTQTAGAGTKTESPQEFMGGSAGSKSSDTKTISSDHKESVQDFLGPYASQVTNKNNDAAFKHDVPIVDLGQVKTDVLNLRQANANALQRVVQGVKNLKDVYPATNEKTYLTPEQIDAAKVLGIPTREGTNGRRFMDSMSTKSADEIAAIRGQQEKQHPELYDSNNPMKESIGNLNRLMLEKSAASNLFQYAFQHPLIERQRYDAINHFLDQKYIVEHPDQFPAVSVEAARNKYEQTLQAAAERKSESAKPLLQKLKEMKDAAVKNPGATAMELAKGIISDPELLAVPMGSAERSFAAIRGLAESGSTLGKVAQTAKVLGELSKPVASGAAVNAGVDVAQQLNSTNGIDPNELKVAAAIGGAFGLSADLAGGVSAVTRKLAAGMFDGVRAKTSGLLNSATKETASAAYEKAMKDAANYDATVDAIVDKKPGVPEELSNTVNKSLGILTDADRKAYIKQRRQDVRAAFKDDPEGMADYLDQLAKSKENLRKYLEENKPKTPEEQAAPKGETPENRSARFQQEFEHAKAVRDATTMDDAHTQAMAEDKLRTAEAQRNAEDAFHAAMNNKNIPEIKRMLNRTAARDAGRGIPKNKRGSIDPTLAAHLGLTTLGASIGYALSPQDHKLQGSILGGLAGAVIPIAFHGDIGDQGGLIRGRQRGVIAGAKAKTADLVRLNDARSTFGYLLSQGHDLSTARDLTYRETGWYKERDGSWRWHIPDTESSINKSALSLSGDKNYNIGIQEVINHPKLFEAYPELRNIQVVSKDLPARERGAYSSSNNTITLSKKLSPEEAHSTILHEMQHAIQSMENHALGGNQQWFLQQDPVYQAALSMKDKLHEKLALVTDRADYDRIQGHISNMNKRMQEAIDRAWRSYWNLLGEGEARAVQDLFTGKATGTPYQAVENQVPRGAEIINKLKNSGHAASETVPDRLQKEGLADEDGNLSGYIFEGDKLPNEDAVIDQAKAGKQAGYTKLFNKYYPRLERAMRGEARNAGDTTSHDIAQEAFIKAFGNIDSFRGDSNFYTWLYRIAKNVASNSRRYAGSRINTESMHAEPGSTGVSARSGHITEGGSGGVRGDVEAAAASHDTPEAVERARETQNILDHAIQKMPDEYSSVFRMKEFDGLSDQEIAKKLDISLGTVRTRLLRARKAIEDGLMKGLGARPPVPKSQRGSADVDFLKTAALVGLGAGAGAYLDRQNKLYGALVGGVVGLIGKPMLEKGLVKGWNSAVPAIIDRMKDMSPELWKHQLNFERNVFLKTHAAIDQGREFLVRVHKLKGPMRDVMRRAILSDNPGGVENLIKAIGDPEMLAGWKKVRHVLDAIRDKQLEMGRYKKGLDDYFPRIVIDQKGLLSHFDNTAKSAIERILHDAQTKSIRMKGRELSDAEKSQLINQYLMRSDVNWGQPGFAKARRLKEIPPELVKYYANPAEAYHSYVRNAVMDIEKATYFGKDLKNVEVNGKTYINDDLSIGNKVQRLMEEGKITPEQSEQLSNMLKARFGFGERPSPYPLQVMKDIGNAGLLGNPISAVTQYGDPVIALYTQGLKPTIDSVARQLTGRKVISVKDFGLTDHISEEFVSTRKTAKFVQKAFKYGLFSFVDNTGKNTVLNAALQKGFSLAKTDKGILKLQKLYGDAWGDQFPKLVDDLKRKKVTEDTTLLAFAELGRSQPITKAHLPEAYLNHPAGRVFYWLHTFQLRMLNLAREDVFKEIKQGHIATGLANMTKLTIVLGMAGAATDNIKKFILGKPLDWSWAGVMSNALKVYGLSNYLLDEATGVTKEEAKARRAAGDSNVHTRKATPSAIITDTLTPPFKMFDQILTGDPRAIRYMPLVGQFLYTYMDNQGKFKKSNKSHKADLSQ